MYPGTSFYDDAYVIALGFPRELSGYLYIAKHFDPESRLSSGHYKIGITRSEPGVIERIINASNKHPVVVLLAIIGPVDDASGRESGAIEALKSHLKMIKQKPCGVNSENWFFNTNGASDDLIIETVGHAPAAPLQTPHPFGSISL